MYPWSSSKMKLTWINMDMNLDFYSILSKWIAKRWKSRSTMFACWNFYDLHQIKSHVYQIDDEKYTTNSEKCLNLNYFFDFFTCVDFHKEMMHLRYVDRYDRLYSQHKFKSQHFNLMWFLYFNVTFRDLCLPRNNDVHFNFT